VALGCAACGSSSAGLPATSGGSGEEASVPDDASVSDASATGATGDDSSAGFTFGGDGSGSTSCQPGEYVGTYTGTFGPSIPVTGPVTISLVPEVQSSGEIALVTNGGTFDSMWGIALGDAAAEVVVTHATLMGELDCQNGMFEATSSNAMFTILTVPAGSATIDFKGMYDPAAGTISGPFTTVSMLGNSQGTWVATLVAAPDVDE
jgi:hypothetical protein